MCEAYQKISCAEVETCKERHAILATEEQLAKLTEAKWWYVDGSFKLCCPPLSKLFSISAFVQQGDYARQVLLLFVLMSSRRKHYYILVIICTYFFLHKSYKKAKFRCLSYLLVLVSCIIFLIAYPLSYL